MASEAAIKSAFRSGDDDADDGLSLSETSKALEKLTGGAHIDESTIEEACESVGVSIGRKEMDADEFVSVVRRLEAEGKL